MAILNGTYFYVKWDGLSMAKDLPVKINLGKLPNGQTPKTHGLTPSKYFYYMNFADLELTWI